jgi:DNA ligase D-like protein (predicted 3'-phosphoesterase)
MMDLRLPYNLHSCIAIQQYTTIDTTGGAMAKKDPLIRYKAKRDFKVTPEPIATKKVLKSKEPMFVIQKHAARALHYDLRLEIGRVLVSWAVPKGPSTNPKVKHLAIQTEDHPLSYGDFEGNIPQGEYGAGPVMVWDIGVYYNIKEDDDGKLIPMKQCLKDGRIEVFLEGHKIFGGYALVRTGKIIGERSQWLLIKMKDEYTDARRNPTNTQNKSVLTGRTMAEIKKYGKEYDE